MASAIDPIASANVHTQLDHPVADWLTVTEIPRFDLAQTYAYARLRDLVPHAFNPFGERFAPISTLIAEKLDHRLIVALELPLVPANALPFQCQFDGEP